MTRGRAAALVLALAAPTAAGSDAALREASGQADPETAPGVRLTRAHPCGKIAPA